MSAPVFIRLRFLFPPPLETARVERERVPYVRGVFAPVARTATQHSVPQQSVVLFRLAVRALLRGSGLTERCDLHTRGFFELHILYVYI